MTYNGKRTQPHPVLEEFGQVMRKQRRRLNLDQSDVAKNIGVSQQTLANWESGLTSPFLLKALEWARELRMDLWPHAPGEL